MTEKVLGGSIYPPDLPKIEDALIAWFQSQELGPLDALFVMLHLSGLILSQESNMPSSLQQGLETCIGVMTGSARQTWRDQSRGEATWKKDRTNKGCRLCGAPLPDRDGYELVVCRRCIMQGKNA